MSVAMKMLVKNIILLLIFRRQINMRIYPTLMIVKPSPKRSGSGSNILNFTFKCKIQYVGSTISAFVDQKVRPLVPEIKSYIKDTNDFLNKLGQMGELPEGSILCTIDVVGLYPHIPHSEGLEALKEALSNSEGQSESERERSLNEDVLSFAELVLKSNNFEFNGRHYLQKRGTAIGTRMAPSYANIFMDRLERRLIQNAEVKPLIWWRYIDDIFIVWTEGEDRLKEFIDYLNNAHDTIKFTYKWSKHEIDFLDVKVMNESGVLETDVFIKPTDSHQYLHYSSCHPGACKRSIPYAQAMRLRRICSKSCFFEKRAEDLVRFLTDRGYKKAYVEDQVEKVRRLTRAEARNNTNQPRSTKNAFCGNLSSGLAKHKKNNQGAPSHIGVIGKMQKRH